MSTRTKNLHPPKTALRFRTVNRSYVAAGRNIIAVVIARPRAV
jgi:hypothetical protein